MVLGMTRELVAYASKMGATEEIAEATGARITELGCLAEVMSAETVDSVDDYYAVVLGSAVYATGGGPRPCGHPLSPRAAGPAANMAVRERLTHTPPSTHVATNGRMATGRQSPCARTDGVRRPARPDLANGHLDRTLAKAMAGDARDWDEIRSWAGQVADTLVTSRT
jgi:menaquinone-dependent protoporphyrinogen oxidase